MCTFKVADEEDFVEKKTKPLVTRENGDYEIRFFFDPSKCSVNVDCLKARLTEASLRTGICGCELKNIKFGEFSVIMNPVVSNEDDREFVIKLFMDYFVQLEKSST